jgi:hypothetical protein
MGERERESRGLRNEGTEQQRNFLCEGKRGRPGKEITIGWTIKGLGK